MNNESNFQPQGNSDDSSGNGQRPNRQRFTRPRNTSFNPNFYRENRTYKPSLRDENGNFNQENRPYNREGSNYNSERPQRNYNNYNREDRPQRSYNNYNREDRPQRTDGNNTERPQRSYNNFNSEQRPQRNYNNYNREDRPQRSYNNYNSEQRPQRNYNNYNREDRPQRSYDNNSERPQRSYDNNSERPQRNYNQEGGFQQRGNYNNYGNRQNFNNRYQNGERRQNFNQEGGYKRPNYGEKFNRDENYDPNAKYSRKKQFEYKQQFVDYSKPMRLNKFLANSSTCSRREADEYIVAGVVKVNGEVVVELGTKIVPATDKVHFHDQLVALEKKVYILLNKPKNCVTTSDDPQERLTVLDLVKNACSERIYPVGRLDKNTTGVILLTNDGDLTSKLTHPKHDKKKIYQIALDKDFTEEDMQKLLDGIMLEDGEMKADDISYVKENRKIIGIEIHSGKNRVVRRMFEHLGYKIIRLDRVFFAGLTKKNLPRGKWRYLSESEVNMLKMSN